MGCQGLVVFSHFMFYTEADSPPTILYPVCIVMPATPPRHTAMPTLLHPNSVLSQTMFDTLSMVFYILYLETRASLCIKTTAAPGPSPNLRQAAILTIISS